MSGGEAVVNASFACAAARSGAREALLVAMLLYALTQGTEALAGEASINLVKDIQPMVGGKPLSPAFLPEKSAGGEPPESTREFRPRQTGATAPTNRFETPSEFEPESLNRTQAAPSNSAWQRLADYRAQGRVQLLTLWESRGSTVSLQAGKHGGPSLQWSSRLMNRGGATRGLLDRFVASSLGAAGLGPKSLSRNSNSMAGGKASNLLPSSKLPLAASP